MRGIVCFHITDEIMLCSDQVGSEPRLRLDQLNELATSSLFCTRQIPDTTMRGQKLPQQSCGRALADPVHNSVGLDALKLRKTTFLVLARARLHPFAIRVRVRVRVKVRVGVRVRVRVSKEVSVRVSVSVCVCVGG